MEKFELFINAISKKAPELCDKYDLNEYLGRKNEEPVHLACDFGHLEIVKFLIDQNIDIEIVDEWKRRPIHSACEKGHEEIVKLLIDHSCNIEVFGSQWNQNPLHISCWEGHVDVVEILINSNCDINARDEDNRSPIYFACKRGHVQIVDLFARHQNCNIETSGGKNKRSPIHLACSEGHVDIVKILINKNCSIETCDKNGKLPIHLACENGHIEIVNLLISLKCDIEACGGKENRRPIHFACSQGHLEIVKVLIAHNCNIEAFDQWKYRPIHYASQKGHIEIAKVLINHHCDLEAINEKTVVNDIVHGIIKIPNYILQIIDTKEFQRLRQISQLGLCTYVYPSSNYSRFEHCIGTFHLASELMKQLRIQLQVDYGEEACEEILTETDIKCLEIAALCHDLGHGCYSHFYEHAFDESIPTRRHEEISVEILTFLLNSTKLLNNQPIKFEIDLSENSIDLIGRIIIGDFNEEIDGKKRFLFEIVANKESGLDVDKFDYLCRDQIYFGWSNRNKIHDIKRILHFFRVVKDDSTGNWHLAMRDREIFHIHDIFKTRNLLHRYGYGHKTVKSVECMFKSALRTIVRNADYREEFIENVIGKRLDYSPKIWFSRDFISRLVDHHLWDMMLRCTPDIVKRIQERVLLKLFCRFRVEFKLPIGHLNEKTRELWKDIRSFQSKLSLEFVDFSLSTFALQSENKGDPLLSVKFYKKQSQKTCFQFREDSLPDLVKLISDETIMMIFVDRSLSDRDRIYLNGVKDQLCGLQQPGENEGEISFLMGKYNFREIDY